MQKWLIAAIVAILIVAGYFFLLADGTHACTLAGCFDVVTIKINQTIPENFIFTANDMYLDTCSTEPSTGGSLYTINNTGAINRVFFRYDDDGITNIMITGKDIEDMPSRISFSFSSVTCGENRTEILLISFESDVQYEKYYPNGPACGPGCNTGTVDLT